MRRELTLPREPGRGAIREGSAPVGDRAFEQRDPGMRVKGKRRSLCELDFIWKDNLELIPRKHCGIYVRCMSIDKNFGSAERA